MKIATDNNLEERIEKFMKKLEDGKYQGRFDIGVEELWDYDTKVHNHKWIGFELRVYDVDHWTSSPDILLECVGEYHRDFDFEYSEIYYSDGEDYITKKEAKEIIFDYLQKKIEEFKEFKKNKTLN